MGTKIDVKDIHQTFWRSRDFELSNLWQRSIFLTAFLVLCFTGYTAVLIKIFECKSFEALIGLHIVEYVLSIIGLIFSVFWIKMAKGSKAWYEVYESAINALETNQEFVNEEISQFAGFYQYKLPNYGGVDINNNLFSTAAGEYSVSKINIGIGQVFMILWSIICFVHIIFIGIIFHDKNFMGYIDILATAFFLSIFLITLFMVSRSKFLKSDSLKDYKKNNKSPLLEK